MRFNVVISRNDGGVEMYPMKQWLRQNPDEVPAGLDPTESTSHQLRNGLRRRGWSVRETPSEVLLIKAGATDPSSQLEEMLGPDRESLADSETPPDVMSFSLESQLRDFIAQNLKSLLVQGRRIRLYVDRVGRDGVEYPTDVGPIDILAIDDAENFFVFELKRATGPDRAVGQIARYMGWVKQTIGRDREVYGVIVAKSISANLRYAVSVVPNISLFEYEVSFQLKAAHELPNQAAANGSPA